MKTKLSQAIAAVAVMGAATAASAATVNANGLGDTLLFPLYTVEAGNQTALHLTNTEDHYKAVKVRFRRAVDSLDVLDFNLYLSPQDQWTGVVGLGEDGNPILVSGDTSCVAGSDANLNLQSGKSFARDESTKGHIEVIEMATWTQAQAERVHLTGTAVDADKKNSLAYAVKHKDGVPGNCGLINKAWYYDENGTNPSGVWTAPYVAAAAANVTNKNNADVGSFTTTSTIGTVLVNQLGDQPKGGLYGNAYVINVDEAWTASYAPTAMTVYDSTVAGNNHHMPRLGLPDLHGKVAEGNSVLGGAVAKFLAHQALDGVFEEGTSEYTAAESHLQDITVVQNHGMDELVGTAPAVGIADALETGSLYSDYVVNADIGANTELAITFPVKYAQTKGGAVAGNDRRINLTFLDSEETTQVSNPSDWQWSPWAPQAAAFLKEETNLLRLKYENGGVDREDMGEAVSVIPAPFTSGWVNIEFVDRVTGKTSESVPAIGFSNIVVKNNVAIPGVNNTYGITHDLKGKK